MFWEKKRTLKIFKQNYSFRTVKRNKISMQKNYLIIVIIILLGNFGSCLEHSQEETNVVTKNNKIVTKTLYHVNVWHDTTFTTEDVNYFEKYSMFSALNVR